jgi:NAD(P)H dehydrogenase (quinone)
LCGQQVRGDAATEQLPAESGLPWTSLRNGFYAHSLTWLAGPWRETGVIAVPGLRNPVG